MDIQTARQLTHAISLLTKEISSIRKILEKDRNIIPEGSTYTAGGFHKDPLSNLEEIM